MKSSTGIRIALLLSLAVVIPACGSFDDNVYVITEVTDDGVPGVLKILAVGADGVDYGGNGSIVQIYANATSSDIKLMRTGKVNAYASIPVLQPAYGPYPRIVEGIELVQYNDYTGGGNNRIRASAPYEAFDATGLWIKPGGILILEPQVDTDSNPNTYEQIDIFFPDSVYVEGTLLPSRKDAFTFGDTSTTNTADLYVATNNVVIAAAGIVQGSGIDVMAGYGGNGGDVVFDTNGTIVNGGLITTGGGDGQGGAQAGDIILLAYDWGTYSSGTLDASGGDGLSEGGGNGGTIQILGESGPAFVTGSVDSSGGNGFTSGGVGGTIRFETQTIGAGSLSGSADTHGGNCTGDDGDGGNGGPIEFVINNGSIRISGSLNARGGNASPNQGGGTGGTIYIDAFHDQEQLVNEVVAPRGVFVGGNIDSSGGTGRWGGNAGAVQISNRVYTSFPFDGVTVPTTAPVMLVGYTTIDVSGGSGEFSGGNAGNSSYVTNTQLGVNPSGNDGNVYPVLSVLNEVDWRIRGGDCIDGYGGNGGSLAISRDANVPPGEPAWDPTVAVYVRNTGNIDLSGGNSSYDYDNGNNYGGNSGTIALGMDMGLTGIGEVVTHENTGDIVANGGNGYYSGYAGTIDIGLYDEGTLINSGNLTARTGQQVWYSGAGSGSIYLQSSFLDGGTITNSGNLDVSGGNGDYYGNYGGTIVIGGGDSVTVTGTLNANGSDGEYGGYAGGNITITSNHHVSFNGTLTANGGDSGGDGNTYGGTVVISTNDDLGSFGTFDPSVPSSLSIAGSISLKGGFDASSSGGNGGTFDSFCHGDVTATATIDVSGANGYYGGYAGSITLESDATITSNAAYTANGGDGDWSAQNGGTIDLIARHVNHTGNISAIGGDALGSNGGNGGSITFQSLEGASTLSGTFNATHGIGFPDGSRGWLYVDGITADDEVLTF